MTIILAVLGVLFTFWLIARSRGKRGRGKTVFGKGEALTCNGPMTDAYFRTMNPMREAILKRDYEKAGRLVRENLEYIPGFVRETRREYGSFDISSIPALEQGGTILALLNDEDGLVRMREIVASTSGIKRRAKIVERHRRDRRLFQAILNAVQMHPNCLQTEVKGLVGETDGHRVANLISYLEKAGKIMRVKDGSSYRLLPPARHGFLHHIRSALSGSTVRTGGGQS